MSVFAISAYGESFDVGAFLAASPLKPDTVWQRGERGLPHSGVGIELGDGERLTFYEQQQTAIDYLSAHGEELNALARFPGVEMLSLTLQYHNETEESVVAFGLRLWPSLMGHTAEIGVTVDIFVSLKRFEWPRSEDA